MSDPLAYDVTLSIGGNELRITVDSRAVRVCYRGSWLSLRTQGDTWVFDVEEEGAEVTYDLLVIRGEQVRCFLGRDGDLIFSDAPGLELDLTDRAR